MWETILTLVVQHWVEFILGLFTAGMGLFVKRYIRLSQEERKRGREEYYSQLMEKIKDENQNLIDYVKQENSDIRKSVEKSQKESREADEALQEQITALRAGMLSIQGREFKAECRRLLAEDHVITLDEWEEIDADHEAYNGLKGNHKGDLLFELVEKKAKSTLTK